MMRTHFKEAVFACFTWTMKPMPNPLRGLAAAHGTARRYNVVTL